MLSVRRGLGLALLVVLAALAVLALPGPAHAAGCSERPLARTFQPWLDDPGEWTIDDVYVDPYKKG